MEILSEPHFLRSISHVRSLPTEVISRPRFYRWQWPGRSLDRTPTPRPLVVGRAWWRKRAASHWALNTLKFQPNAQFAVLWNLLFPCLRLQTNSWKYNLVEHLYGKNVSHFPHGPVVVIRSPISCPPWFNLRWKQGFMAPHQDETPWQHELLWGHGNLEPKTHRLRIMAPVLISSQKATILQSPIFAGAPVGRQHPANQLM